LGYDSAMRYPSLALALAFVGALGCGSDGPIDPATYFQVQPYANPACNNVDQRLAGLREMRLYLNGGALVPITQGLARYYHRHSLSFFTASAAQGTTMAYALDTNEGALNAALIAAFPGVDFSNRAALMADPVLWDQILSVVANFLLRPMIDFANTHSDGGTGLTNLIVVRELERPGGSSISEPGSELAGLAISPALLAEFARTMPEEANIWKGVHLPADFTPMMVLGHNVLQRGASADPVLRDLVASHEFGHTAALVHTLVPGNLMYRAVAPGIDDCTDSLDDSQLSTMRATLGLATAASGALLATGAGAIRGTGPSGRRAPFTPDRLQAMLAGDRRAMRSFVEQLFHGPAGL
jgi:hypothetical protein